jgi:nucleotide-binding universal stress UspA family protein
MRILVATDFSDGARNALTVAAQYARTLHATIDLMHVSPLAGTDVGGSAADVIAQAGDVPLTFVGRSGDPADEILRYAAMHAVELIVVGTHGRTGVSRLLLGSVAERVTRGATCPVLVVPAAV